MISIIAAIAENNAIGLKGKLLYWLPADLRRFKALTTGHTVIMGRKTFESLPGGALPNRRNVVLSRREQNFPGAERFASLAEALASCPAHEDIYIIGGASVYAEALPLAIAFASPKYTTHRQKPMPSSPSSTAMNGKSLPSRDMKPTRNTTKASTL